MSQQASLLEGERTEKAQEIKKLLDNELDRNKFENRGELTQESIKCFQQLFVEKLNFEPTTGLHDIAEQISTEDWSKGSKAEGAYIIAEAYDFRVLYIKLEKLTRTAERNAVRSMRARDWAKKGEYISIFHDGESDVWHLVSPRKEEGESRIVLRRYVIGKGETHRTVSSNLALMDVDRPEPLYDRVQEAFKLQPVTKKFYKDYKEEYNRMYEYLKEEDAGLDIQKAKKFTHLTLNRLMFIYFLQKKKWLPQGKNFMNWFVDKYQESSDEGCFHEKWLNTLFFESMNTPENQSISREFPEDVKDALESIPFFNGGLFEKKGEIEVRSIQFEDKHLIHTIKNFLENYNFTVTEESPFDKEVAVDPAMLGKIYESLIAEEERGKSGIFYTPRDEVDLMCRLALYEHLLTKAEEPGEKGKKEIIEFLFKPIEEWDKGVKDVEGLMDLLHGIKVVDPACGSGAFLVGMMQVFNELYRKLGKEPDYQFRERIVQENLHGVDIKDWAVRMAEFRLWLALVENEDDVPNVEPVLPNFDFKLKVGDSIVQKVGEEPVSLDKIMRKSESRIEKQINELMEMKREYFEGKSDLDENIEEKQKNLIKSHLEDMIQRLEDKKSQNQVNLSGEITVGAKKENENIEEQIEKIKDTVKKIDEIIEDDFFWDLDFPEVMLEGGFDIVIGNPPYVPHQEIVPQDIPLEVIEDMVDSEFSKIKNEYKDDLIDYCEKTFDYKPYRKSDLYLYFYFKSLEILKENGILVFITSNAWLDVAYGKRLQEALIKETNIIRILENRIEKVFEKQDVNTAIGLLKKKTEIQTNETHFSSLQYQDKNITDTNLIKKLLLNDFSYDNIQYRNNNLKVTTEPNFRNVKVDQGTLWALGNGNLNKTTKGTTLTGNYKGNMWGALFFRAPNIFYKILENNESKLYWIDKENVETYLNTGGADDFFFVDLKGEKNEYYLVETEDGDVFELEKNYIDDFVESPKQLSSIKIETEEAKSHLLKIPRDIGRKELKEKKVWDYVKWGEDKGYNKKSGRKNKDRWEILPQQAYKTSEIQIGCYMSHPRIFYNPQKLITHRFFRYYPPNKFNKKSMALSLNSSITLLAYELFRNPSLGGGVLAVSTDSIRKFIFVDPECIELPEEVVENFLSREQKSIFEELGFEEDMPIEEQEPNPEEDRKQLDEAIFDMLDISENDRTEIYRSLAKLTYERLKKGSS